MLFFDGGRERWIDGKYIMLRNWLIENENTVKNRWRRSIKNEKSPHEKKNYVKFLKKKVIRKKNVCFFFFVQYTYEVWWELATHRKGQSFCTHPVLAAPEDVVVDFLNNFPFVFFFFLLFVAIRKNFLCSFFSFDENKKTLGFFFILNFAANWKICCCFFVFIVSHSGIFGMMIIPECGCCYSFLSPWNHRHCAHTRHGPHWFFVLCFFSLSFLKIS